MTKTTRLAAALLTSGLALGALTTSFAPAGAVGTERDVATVDTDAGGVETLASIQTFRNERYSDLCMDGYNDTVAAYECGEGDADDQRWRVHRWGDGTVRLQNVQTGECLDDGGGTLGTSARCTSSRYQSFYVKHWDDGTIRFQNQGSRQCVKAVKEREGFADVGSSTCDSSEAQSWK